MYLIFASIKIIKLEKIATIILVYLKTTSSRKRIINILFGISVAAYVSAANAKTTGNSFLVLVNFLNIITIKNKTTEI